MKYVLALTLIWALSFTVSAASVQIELWTPFGAGINGDALNGLIEQFNESQEDIVVVHRAIPGDIAQQYTVAVAGGAPPDIGWVAPDWFAKLYSEDVVVPIDTLATRDNLDTGQFWPGTWGWIEGRQWGYPFEVGSEALLYNKDRFAETGLDEAPGTWDEFLATAKKLTDLQEGRYGVHPSWAAYMAVQWIWRNNGRLVTEDLSRATLTDPATVSALQWYGDLQSKHNVVGGDLPSGTAGMIVVHTGWYGFAKTFPFETATGPAPIPVDGRRASLSYYKELVIFKTIPAREEAAWRFVKWLMAPEQQAVWATKTGYLPVSRSVLETGLYADYLEDNPGLMPWIDELQYIRHFPPAPSYGQVLGIFQEAVDRVRQGEAAYVVLASLQERAQAILDEANRE